MTSSLITSITSVLSYIRRSPPSLYELDIGLMNLKGILLCLRMLGIDLHDDANVIEFASHGDAVGWSRILKAVLCCHVHHHPGMFSRIQNVIRRIDAEKYAMCSYPLRLGPLFKITNEVHFCVLGVAKQVDDELLNQSSSSSFPGVEEIVGIIDSILANSLDFLRIARGIANFYKLGLEDDLQRQEEAMGSLEVQATFLKHFLAFANRTGVESEPLRNVLIQVQPFVINAVLVFIPDAPGFETAKWIHSVQTKCSTAIATDPRACRAYAQALTTSSLSSTGSKALQVDDAIFSTLRDFLDSLISLFWDVLRHSDLEKYQLKVLYERLRFSRAILKQQQQQPLRSHEIGGVICDAAIVLFSSLHQTDADMSNLDLSDLMHRFDAIQAHALTSPSQMSELSFPKPKKTSINIFHWNEKPLTLQPRGALSSHQPLHNNTSQVVGFQNEKVTSVLDQLTRGSKQLRIVPIVGMAGLGKTTFALQLYNHVSIRYHFHARAWCSISQVLDKKRVFLFLLNQTKPGTNTSNMSEDDLADEFRKSIIGRTYLIFLDDVWTPQVWDSLNEAFPDDSTSSRVILTSRHHDIAPHDSIADGKPYLLRPREVNECLEILQAKLFPEQGCWPLKLNQLGIEFAKKCKELPLTVVIVAGLLVTSTKQDWKHILDSLSSGSLSREEQCNSALELSFKHLPNNLKLCFLYFAVFPEDEEINVKTLIRYWMAEGFVQKIKSKRIEDVAREYMDRLIEISLVKVAKMRSIGGVKTCRIHDLLHEFCQAKARQRNFCSCDQVSDFNESHSLQRLSIHSNPLHFQRSGLFCPSLHSLLFFSTGPSTGHGHPLFHVLYITQIYKLLKVLELGRILLPSKIPSEIGSLTLLAYLSIQSSFCVVPSSIGNLSNLETFIVVFKSNLSEHIPFPHTIWNLKNLKHLHVPGGGLTLPNENLENSPMLLGLETLTGVVFGCNGSMERQMRKFPNIRRLSCGILPDVNKIVIVPDSFSHLESLTIIGHRKLLLRFGSTENLRKLSLSFLKLSREGVTIIGQFPNLEVLKLWEIFYEGDILEMEEGGFSTVKYLDLTAIDRNLERWIASDEQLPNLKKLVLMGCEQLIEIPSCLNTIPTLEEIQLIDCSPTVESLVRCIEEAQEDYGNSLKVNITR